MSIKKQGNFMVSAILLTVVTLVVILVFMNPPEHDSKVNEPIRSGMQLYPFILDGHKVYILGNSEPVIGDSVFAVLYKPKSEAK